MRLHLSSSTPPVDAAILTFRSAGTFTPAAWINLGYNNYEVICIGASGGRGGHSGNYSGTNSNGGYFLLGGGPGGGGMHIVRGLLSSLPLTVPVVVGGAGANGANQLLVETTAGNGGSGGATTFNGTLCRASGGTGGQGANLNLTGGATHSSQGGQGGIGGTTTAGGGGVGAQNGDPSTTTRRTAGAGVFNEPTGIGAGGGGGAGGLGAVNPSNQPIGWFYKAIAGGVGNYPDAQSSANRLPTVYAHKKQDNGVNPALLTDGVAESGGGANARIVSNESYIAGTYHASLYAGSSTTNGLCIIKLTP